MTYLYFGGRQASDPMPDLGGLVGKIPRTKTARANTRIIKKNRFEPIDTTAELLDRMFGAVRPSQPD